jgi:hypothetical protein
VRAFALERGPGFLGGASVVLGGRRDLLVTASAPHSAAPGRSPADWRQRTCSHSPRNDGTLRNSVWQRALGKQCSCNGDSSASYFQAWRRGMRMSSTHICTPCLHTRSLKWLPRGKRPASLTCTLISSKTVSPHKGVLTDSPSSQRTRQRRGPPPSVPASPSSTLAGLGRGGLVAGLGLAGEGLFLPRLGGRSLLVLRLAARLDERPNAGAPEGQTTARVFCR